ncbi:MAG: hypothetical protein AB8B48_15040 [Pseudomonadales bacterium]
MSDQLDAVKSIRDAAVTRLQKEVEVEKGYSFRDYQQGIEMLLSCPPKNALPSPSAAAPRRSKPATQKPWTLDIWAGRKVLSLEWFEQSEEIEILSFRRGDWEEVVLSL